jgi:DNA-binding TFAR19-related protein (PDSD5 family)
MPTDDEDQELKRIRMARMQNLLKQKQQAQLASEHHPPSLADKIDQVLQVLLAPAARNYLAQIHENNVSAYNQIRQILFPPQIIAEIDQLIYYLRNGMIRQGVITLVEIQRLERKVLGIESRITVKRQGHEATSLSSYMKAEE